MSTKLLIAAILLAGLSGLVYWSNKHQAAEDAKPAKDAPPKLITIADDQVKRIEVQKKGSDPVVIDKNSAGTQWSMETPKQWPVDRDAAASLSSAFTGLTWDRLVEDKAGDLAQYGLADPQLKVTATAKNNKSQTLLLGDDTPAGGGVFAKLENDPRVFTIQSGTKSNFDKTPQDLRDKRLLTFAQEKLSRIEVTGKGQTFEFGRNSHSDWQIVRPKPYRADSFQVEELVRKLKDARMESTPDAKPLTFTGSPVATIKLTDDTGTQQIEIRKTGKDKDATYLAKSSVVDGIYKVSSDLGEQAAKSMQDYRNKKPFEFGFKDVGKIDMQDGSTVYSFQRSGENWTSKGKQLDSIGVSSLLDKLRDLTATSFSEKPVGPPQITISVSTTDGKFNEKVEIAKEASGYFAKRENDPTVYELPPDAVAGIQRAAADVKPATPAPGAKK